MPGHSAIHMNTLAIEIVESSYEPTADGRGMELQCTAQVVQEQGPGPLIALTYVLEHADPQIQERGQREFAGLRRAVGVLAPEDTQQLHWKPFRVQTSPRENKDTGEMENVIRKYTFDDEAPPMPKAA